MAEVDIPPRDRYRSTGYSVIKVPADKKPEDFKPQLVNSQNTAAIKVYLVDQSYKTILVTTNHTVDALAALTAKRLGLPASAWNEYGICILVKNKKLLDCPANPYKLHKKWGVQSGRKYKFLFKKRIEGFNSFIKTMHKPTAMAHDRMKAQKIPNNTNAGVGASSGTVKWERKKPSVSGANSPPKQKEEEKEEVGRIRLTSSAGTTKPQARTESWSKGVISDVHRKSVTTAIDENKKPDDETQNDKPKEEMLPGENSSGATEDESQTRDHVMALTLSSCVSPRDSLRSELDALPGGTKPKPTGPSFAKETKAPPGSLVLDSSRDPIFAEEDSDNPLTTTLMAFSEDKKRASTVSEEAAEEPPVATELAPQDEEDDDDGFFDVDWQDVEKEFANVLGMATQHVEGSENKSTNNGDKAGSPSSPGELTRVNPTAWRMDLPQTNLYAQMRPAADGSQLWLTHIKHMWGRWVLLFDRNNRTKVLDQWIYINKGDVPNDYINQMWEKEYMLQQISIFGDTWVIIHYLPPQQYKVHQQFINSTYDIKQCVEIVESAIKSGRGICYLGCHEDMWYIISLRRYDNTDCSNSQKIHLQQKMPTELIKEEIANGRHISTLVHARANWIVISEEKQNHKVQSFSQCTYGQLAMVIGAQYKQARGIKHMSYCDSADEWLLIFEDLEPGASQDFHLEGPFPVDELVKSGMKIHQES